MATDIQICSNALLMIGAGTISSFTEGGNAGTVASNLYESTLQNLLTIHPWKFAKAKKTLSQLVATPLNEWSYAYQMPAEALMIIRVYPDSNYDIYEDKIYSDQSSLECDYIYQPNEPKFPAYFRETLEYLLAAKFAIPVTENASTAEVYSRMYQDALRRAKSADSQSRPQVAPVHQPFIEVRG